MIGRFLRRVTKSLRLWFMPLRLWINRIQFDASEREIERLRMLRADTCNLERIEQSHQVNLVMRSQDIKRGVL